MKNQVSQIRLISMFYLSVFVLAFLVSGLLSTRQKAIAVNENKGQSTIFSVSGDSASLVKHAIILPSENNPDVKDVSKKGGNHDFSSWGGDFNSLLQWFFRLPAKNF